MKTVFIISIVLIILTLSSCAASKPQFVTKYAGQKITVTGTMDETTLVVYINDKKVIDQLIVIYQVGMAEGKYEGLNAIVIWC